MTKRILCWEVVLACSAFAAPSLADIAPPPVDACALLAPGSPCTTAGRLRGECVKVAEGERSICRLFPSNSTPDGGIALNVQPSAAGKPSTPLKAAAPKTAVPKTACAYRPPLHSEGSRGALLCALALAILRNRRVPRGVAR
jgi:hypothetical protein